jgi:hypothetical protein
MIGFGPVQPSTQELPDGCKDVADQSQRGPGGEEDAFHVVISAAETKRTDSCNNETAGDTCHQKEAKDGPSDPPPIDDREDSAERYDAHPDEIARQVMTRQLHLCDLPTWTPDRGRSLHQRTADVWIGSWSFSNSGPGVKLSRLNSVPSIHWWVPP